MSFSSPLQVKLTPFAEDAWTGLEPILRAGWVLRKIHNSETVQSYTLNCRNIA